MEKKGTPNLPFYFKILVTFLENVKVSPAHQKDLDTARNALKEILEMVYASADTRVCTGQRPLYPPIE